MRVETEGGATYGACPQCAGLWFGDGELRALMNAGPQAMDFVEETNRPVRDTQVTGSLVCPDCGKGLMAYKYAYVSPVELDGCESCGGVFVQDGELAAINEWKSAQASKGDAADALAAMSGDVERARTRSERVQSLARVAMMRRQWMTWDTSDVMRTPPDDQGR